MADGTYTGAGNKNLDFGGKAITVQSENGADACIIDCEADGRGFSFTSGEGPDSVVQGFNIIRGRGPGWGGNILCHGASPTITRCLIADGVVWHRGGGIDLQDSSAVITHTVISNNVAMLGGGVSCYVGEGTPAFFNCLIIGNFA